MICREDGDYGKGDELARVEIVARHLPLLPYERDVDLPTTQRLDLFPGRKIKQPDFDLRMHRTEVDQRGVEQVLGGGAKIADLEFTFVSLRQSARLGQRCLVVGNQRFGPFREEVPGIRRAHPCRRTLQKPPAHFAFQRLHLPGKSRLRHAQTSSGPVEAAFPEDDDKGAKLGDHEKQRDSHGRRISFAA